MGMPHLSIFAIANLHQTCLGLVWRFAQDGLSLDGDIPETIYNLWYPRVCRHLSSIFVSRWCWWWWYQIDLVSVGIPAVIKYLRQRASCSEMQCLMAKWCITAPSSGDELHLHCLVCSAFFRICHLTDSCLKPIAFFGLAMPILDVKKGAF